MKLLKALFFLFLLAGVAGARAAPACDAGCQKTLAALPVAKTAPTPKIVPVVKDAAFWKRQAEAAESIRRSAIVINNAARWDEFNRRSDAWMKCAAQYPDESYDILEQATFCGPMPGDE